jgi:hypothetical protein
MEDFNKKHDSLAEAAKEILDENFYRTMSVDDVTRAVDALSNVLRKGSNLNKELNKRLGGNYDRDFKEMKDALDEVYDKWEDLLSAGAADA